MGKEVTSLIGTTASLEVAVATKYTREVLEEAASASESIAGVMRYLGLQPSGSMHCHLSKRIKEFGIDISHFQGQSWRRGVPDPDRLRAEVILVYNRREGKKEATYRLRRALGEIGRPCCCEVCGLNPEWNGKELRLQIDHKDGDILNNRPKNLRFLCPNCHSQTENYGSYKNAKFRERVYCSSCDEMLNKGGPTGLCRRCSNQRPRTASRKISLSQEELRNLVWKKPVRQVAEDFGVSDTAVH
ncbi:hypothetical protein LCGC14_2942230, partial [marine sediment metagenome]